MSHLCWDTCCRPEQPTFTVLSERYRTAAKEHRCGSCRQPIAPGARYRAHTYLLDGDFYSDKDHVTCLDQYAY